MRKTEEEILQDNGFDYELFQMLQGFYANNIILAMRQFAAQEVAEVNKWISVEERLPEECSLEMSDLVLFVDNTGAVRFGRYDFVYKKWNCTFYAGEKVTHWQTIIPPKILKPCNNQYVKK